VQGREAKGQGTAAAVIENRLEQQNGSTKVVAVTDLKITGRQAQFGRGIMEDVANTMMAEFAKRLEEEIKSGGPSAEPAAEAKPAAAAEPQRAAPRAEEREEPEALDVGNVLARTPAVRYGAAGVVLLVLLGVLAALLRGRKPRAQLTLNLNLGK
jgi:hypothetical protein